MTVWALIMLVAFQPVAWSQSRGSDPPESPGRDPTLPPERSAPSAAVTEIVVLLLPGQVGAADLGRELNLTLVAQYALLLLDARLAIYRLPTGRTTSDVLAQLAQRQILADENGPFFQPQQDPLATRQYSLEKVGAVRAHMGLRGRGVTVAIVDAGVDAGHEDLREGVAAAESLIEGMPSMTADPHGTAVAGIIGARDNNVGIIGIAPGARLVALQACVPRRTGAFESTCTAHRVGRAIDAAARHQAHIINISLGGPPNRVVTKLIEAVMAQGTAVVAAAGNNGPSGPALHPAAIPGVLAVGATDSRDLPYERSNMGRHVTILAPGVDLMTTVPQQRYLFVSGTSFAAAATSGSLALLVEAAAGRPARELIAVIAEGGVRIGGWSIARLDLCRSLALLGRPDCR